MRGYYKRDAYKRLMKPYRRKVGWYLTLVVSNHTSFTLGYSQDIFPVDIIKRPKQTFVHMYQMQRFEQDFTPNQND